jgi:DNA-binding transcriptional MerR regulator
MRNEPSANRPAVTIGELSRRTGLPVKTLRFWSDEGLLPPAARSKSGYRLYGEEALVRLDLVRSLREAGLGLDAIRKVLRRDLSLAAALRLHLATVEAHVASLQRVAAALRAAIAKGEPDESDVRRLCAVTRLTNEERKKVIEDFYARVSEGIPVDDAWRQKMIGASTPNLPDNPTQAQLDAWIELADLVQEPSFVEYLRTSAKETWDRKVDVNVLRQANETASQAAAAARARGDSPESAAGRAIVDAYVEGISKATGKPISEAMKRGVRERFERHDPRASRYWELVAIMNGRPPGAGNAPTVADWRFITDAIKHHLS